MLNDRLLVVSCAGHMDRPSRCSIAGTQILPICHSSDKCTHPMQSLAAGLNVIVTNEYMQCIAVTRNYSGDWTGIAHQTFSPWTVDPIGVVVSRSVIVS
jgi:hypothetical protein